MKEQTEILVEIERLTKDYFARKVKKSFVPGRTRIPLSIPSYGAEEAFEAIESILTTWVTMGKKVEEFEKVFARYAGTSDAVLVHSGSSANLLALSMLTSPLMGNRIEPGDEVITPAVTFATTVYPIINVGAVPVLVDVDMKTLNLSPEEVEKAITDKTKAIMPVHLLGNPCDIKRIMEIANEHDLFVIEDACDSSGAEVDGQKVGSFGDLATFSFFFTHIMSTIEGGMLTTNNKEHGEMARSMRSFGWTRDLSDKDAIAEEHKHIDPRFLFINMGYNFKTTDIQGAFGIHQIKKLDSFVESRRKTANFWAENLKEFSDYVWGLEEQPGTKSAWYGYPVTVRPDAPFSREDLTGFLASKGVETRPILSGNMDEQPVMRLVNYRKEGDLPNSRTVQRHSFWVGNHHGIGEEEREAVADYFREFMSRRTK